jgi:pimeloyl-ACP methyl ester carboxylesterase
VGDAHAGVIVDVEERGEGRPILFVHGLTFDRRMLLEASEPIFDHARARRLYADLPGHGASPGDARAASAEGLVEALAGLVDAACAGTPPVVVGHSYGGYLALGLATVRPVAGLVLVTPVVEPDLARRVVPPRRVAELEPELGYSPGAPERAMFEEIAVVQSSAVLTAYQRLVHAASERTDRAFLEQVRRRYVLPGPVLAQLAERAPRTLVLCGRDDHWVGYEDALVLVRALPCAELVVLPGCGQLMPIEAGERYRALVGEFFARL